MTQKIKNQHEIVYQRLQDSGEGVLNGKIQQSDYLKNFTMCILNQGLQSAYETFGENIPGPRPKRGIFLREIPSPAVADYDVVIVGAGIAGISAAFELKRAGCKVKILEQTNRYGGRIFTYADPNLAPGLYAEAGAMRLPGKFDDPQDRQHFLTEGYIAKFGLQVKKFPNYDPNGLTNIYGFIDKTSAWAEKHFDKVWPKWRLGIKGKAASEISNIDEYYERTTAVVTDQLRKWLDGCSTVEEEVIAWAHWIDIWSQFSLESFLESNIEVICAKVQGDARENLDIETLGNLLPWSDDAVRGYSVFSYTEQLDQSLVQYLQNQLGQWWSPKMHCLKGGMHKLADAFFGEGEYLDKAADLDLERRVSKITYTFHKKSPEKDFVEVTCYAPNDNKVDSEKEIQYVYTAKAVIVTTPVNILRQITFKPTAQDETTKVKLRKTTQAIENIFTGTATKIFLQTKTRFWEHAPYNIHGGFSKTNLPIGQIHYVSPEDDPNASAEEKKKGLLLIYTWKNEALIFGSMTKEQVKQEAIEQVAEIHKEINEDKGHVDLCIVHAWYNQPSYQGAYGLTKKSQFNNIRQLWEPMGNVHFAGETFSFASGWIQGALESGLKAAYQVYQRRMEAKQHGRF